jgi:hypothetical protein
MEEDMTNVISVFQTYFEKKIGRCARCMRQALATATVGWLLAGAAVLTLPGSVLVPAAAVAAAALTALWLLHVIAHAGRATARTATSDPVVQSAARRRALGSFARAAGIGLLASIPVVSWSSKALAFCGQCTKNDDCGVGWSCKNTAAVNENVCNECVQD